MQVAHLLALNEHGTHGEQYACAPLRAQERLAQQRDGPEQRRQDLQVGQDLEGAAVHELQREEEQPVVDGVTHSRHRLQEEPTQESTKAMEQTEGINQGKREQP